MALLPSAKLAQRFANLGTVGHEAGGLLDRLTFGLSTELALVGHCPADAFQVHDLLHFVSAP